VGLISGVAAVCGLRAEGRLLIGLHSSCGLCSWLVFGLLAKGGVLELSKCVNGSRGLFFSLAFYFQTEQEGFGALFL
jgi:hypothetical protein